jgi:hypothetical protein
MNNDNNPHDDGACPVCHRCIVGKSQKAILNDCIATLEESLAKLGRDADEALIRELEDGLPALPKPNDPLRRAEGAALCPERLPVEVLESIRRQLGTTLFSRGATYDDEKLRERFLSFAVKLVGTTTVLAMSLYEHSLHRLKSDGQFSRRIEQERKEMAAVLAGEIPPRPTRGRPKVQVCRKNGHPRTPDNLLAGRGCRACWNEGRRAARALRAQHGIANST